MNNHFNYLVSKGSKVVCISDNFAIVESPDHTYYSIAINPQCQSTIFGSLSHLIKCIRNGAFDHDTLSDYGQSLVAHYTWNH